MKEKNSDSAFTKYWQVAPGESGRLWDDLRSQSIAAVGYSQFDFDLAGRTHEELIKLGHQRYPSWTERKLRIRIRQLWDFLSLKPGDKIITNKGVTSLLALGIVKSGYKYRGERTEYKHTIDIEYYKISESGIPIPDKFKRKYFGKTIVPVPRADFEEMEQLFNGSINYNYWIFQANQKFYDLSGALKVLNKFHWGVYQHKKEIAKNDIVFLWEAGPDAGILALSAIEDNPRLLPELEAELPYIREHEKFAENKLQVPLKIQYVLPKKLSRDDLKRHPLLKDIQILKFAQGTNFSLTKIQGDALIMEIRKIKELHLSFYIPDRDDVVKIFKKIAKLGDEVDVDQLKKAIEIECAKQDRKLDQDWWEITKKNLIEWSKKG